MKNDNIILNTDSYKVSMFKQYPPQTSKVYSYIESRGGAFDETVFFGLQAFLKDYMTDPVTMEQVNEAEAMWTAHGEPFNREGWEYIVNELGGKLPLEIRAIPEGTVVPTGIPLVTIVNTDPKCFWLTTWVETSLLRSIWYPTTVATLAYEAREEILAALEKSGDPEGVDFKLHDFGARGVSSEESSALGGAAHLLSFAGTDNMSGILLLKRFYDADMAGFSIPAAEHSTITSWGKYNEEDAYRNMVNQFSPDFPLIAVVSDSYDIYNAAKNLWGKNLKELVQNSGTTIVIRPDSGEPVEVVTEVLRLLDGEFGSTVNDKGYKVLNNVRVIQGDGIDLDMIKALLEATMAEGFSIDNLAFGMGGGLLQHVNRDTQKFAMKCSSILIGESWFDVKKNPVTDKHKASKAGRIAPTRFGDDGEEWSVMNLDKDPALESCAELVYLDGEVVKTDTLEDIRARLR
jgi:nicotinamide phosphoribosyltransferase